MKQQRTPAARAGWSIRCSSLPSKRHYRRASARASLALTSMNLAVSRYTSDKVLRNEYDLIAESVEKATVKALFP